MNKYINLLPGDPAPYLNQRSLANPNYAFHSAAGRYIVLCPTLRVLKMVPFAADGSDPAQVMAYLEALPPPSHFAGFELQAPILVLPNVFEPDFCQRLIDLYEAHGGEESGFMREVNGKTSS